MSASIVLPYLLLLLCLVSSFSLFLNSLLHELLLSTYYPNFLSPLLSKILRPGCPCSLNQSPVSSALPRTAVSEFEHTEKRDASTACGPLPPVFPLGFLVGFLNSSGNPDCFRFLRVFRISSTPDFQRTSERKFCSCFALLVNQQIAADSSNGSIASFNNAAAPS